MDAGAGRRAAVRVKQPATGSGQVSDAAAIRLARHEGATRSARPARRTEMKVLASVKKICRKCKIIRRNRVVRVICADPRHKQRQG